MGSSLLGSLAAWVTANPAVAVLTLALAPPLVAVVLARLFGRRDTAPLELEPPPALRCRARVRAGRRSAA